METMFTYDEAVEAAREMVAEMPAADRERLIEMAGQKVHAGEDTGFWKVLGRVAAENRGTLRFFWNGIKAGDGKLQPCSYSGAELLHSPAGTITIYAKRSFSAEVRQSFTVENDTDSMTDYFEHDRIRVRPNHPLYPQVKAALAAREAHYSKRFTKRPDLYGRAN
jgi:hypothetical protein